MRDKFTEFVHYNIYKIEEYETSIKIEISRDMFNRFYNDIEKKKNSKPIEITIYDESQIKNNYDKLIIQRFLKKLNNLTISNITIITSNETLPIYNTAMNTIKWKHEPKTTTTLKLDRNPIDSNIRMWYLSKAIGKLNISQEKLIWITDNELNKLYNKLDPKLIEDTKKLKNLIYYLDKYIRRNYNTENMTNMEKILIIINFIKQNIRNELSNTKKNTQKQKYLYEIWQNKKGTYEEQTKLMSVLLNNPLIKIDSTLITVRKEGINHILLGIMLGHRLYSCCLIEGTFKNLEKENYIINNDPKQIYPTIYEHASLSEEDIKHIQRKVKLLKK